MLKKLEIDREKVYLTLLYLYPEIIYRFVLS